MMQFSYVSLGARSTRQLGSQFMNGVSYLGGRGKAAVSAVSSGISGRYSAGSKRPTGSLARYAAPKVTVQSARESTRSSAPTGTTTRAPRVQSSNKVVPIGQVTVRRVAAKKAIKKEDKAA